MSALAQKNTDGARTQLAHPNQDLTYDTGKGGGNEGQGKWATGPTFEDCKLGVLKFSHSALHGENY